MKTFDGYKKQALTDVYALLAGGGHKPLSEFSMAHTHPYLPLSGGTITGNIILKGGTSPDMTYAGNVHPYIRFDNSDSSLNVSLIFTDYDSYRSPAGIKLVGNQGNEWFEAANIYANMFYGTLSGNASTATNADKVDGYHASSLWRSDGATWNPGANVSLNASANNQEWSFDIRRNGYTGCYWHVWDSTLSTLLKVNADNGKVYAPYNFVGNLEGNASSSSKWLTARTLSLTGSITGSVSFDGSGNIALNTTYGTENISNLDNRYVKKAGDTMNGNLGFTSGKKTIWSAIGDSYITNGNVDSGTTLGGNLANLVISSWYGVSFTTSCNGQTYTNKTAVGINCRTGIVYAANFVGPLQGNASSATKLQTPRTIWGQSFNGTADVNGTIYINNSDSSNGAIRLNNNVNSNARISAISDQVIFNTGSAIRFGGTSWDWNQWAGLKYTHSNKTIYLGIADNSIFNANSTLSGGTLNLRAGISNIDLNSGTSIRGLATNGSPYASYINLYDTSISLSTYGDISMSTGPGAIKLTAGLGAKASIGSDFKIESSRGVYLTSGLGTNASINPEGFKVEASQGVYLNSGNSGYVYLCLGGGRVGIGTNNPLHELYVWGNTFTKGFGIMPYYLSDSNLLPTISPGDGYVYRCLEIGNLIKISCIIADKVSLSGNIRGVLIRFKEGYDGLIVLLKDLLNYGSGNGYFWVMPIGCNIIRADGSGTLISYSLISNLYDDGKSRFFVYSFRYSAWIEFLCA